MPSATRATTWRDGRCWLPQIMAQPARKRRLVFGMVDDKDLAHVMELLPREAIYYWTHPSTHRAFPAEKVAECGRPHDLHGPSIPPSPRPTARLRPTPPPTTSSSWVAPAMSWPTSLPASRRNHNCLLLRENNKDASPWVRRKRVQGEALFFVVSLAATLGLNGPRRGDVLTKRCSLL